MKAMPHPAMTWFQALRTSVAAGMAGLGRHVGDSRRQYACEGCQVTFHPALTDERCPICNALVPGASGTPVERIGRPFALRFAWFFGALVLLILIHLFYP